MKKTVFTLIILTAAIAALTACNIVEGVQGSGNVVEQAYEFTDFDEVEFGHAFVATVTQGDTYNVLVRVDDNLVDRLVVEQDGNRVRIGMADGTMVTRGTLEADITLPDLTQLIASGASRVQLNPFSLNDLLTANASGAAQIHGDVDAVDLELDASGASTLFLAGTAANVHAVASGASTIDLTELSAVDAQTEANGASNVTVNITGILDADASGGSNIYYLGDPEMGDVQTSGGSNVEQR